ncbi:MAG: tetratricopeptide repeat protein [Neisseriaceae bacterium]|nr:MAG: tetratricopeptide repeat protein [Neisseriaceae bacterium]
MENNTFIWLIPIILLPIFFSMGWLAARIDMRAVLKQAKSIPMKFYKSLDAIIDNKTNIAAETLQSIIDEQHEKGQQIRSYELGLTLGKLFRKRGENDKAIALHQKLLSLPNIPETKLQKIQFELGQDYQAAGLVNRAEKQFEDLLNSTFKQQASQILLDIYQQDRDWEKAIEMVSKFPQDGISQQFDLAQFYCELAQKALIESHLDQAHTYAKKALDINKKCTRTNIILGDIEFKRGNYANAIEAYTAIENQNYAYLTMVGEKIYDAYDAMHKAEEGLNLLIGYMNTFPQLNLTNLIYEKALLIWNLKKANEITANLIRINPNLEKIYLLTDIAMFEGDPTLKKDANIIKKILSNQISKSFMYQCKQCHFKSQVFFWRCPACGKWETFTPNRIEV